MRPQQSLMRPQYFVFEWLLMSALLYYNKFYDIYSLAAAPFGLNEGIAAAAAKVASQRYLGCHGSRTM